MDAARARLCNETLVPKLRLGMQAGKLRFPSRANVWGAGVLVRETEFPGVRSQTEFGTEENDQFLVGLVSALDSPTAWLSQRAGGCQPSARVKWVLR